VNAPSRAELTVRLVADLGTLFHVHAAYAPGHPQVKGTVDRVLAALSAWCAHAGSGEASLLLLEGHLLLDRQPIPDGANWALGLARAFRRHGIGGMTLLRGLEPEELRRRLPPALRARCRPARGLAAALASARNDAGPAGLVVVAGSLFLVGEVLAAVRRERRATVAAGT
jgi:GNAT superfamily N-acetyltransferase